MGLVVMSLCVACGSERAVRVLLEIDDADGDSVCLVASASGEVVFASSYEVATLPAGERSLTFVAGERVSDALTLSARVSRDGRTVARASSEARFGDQGVVEQRLRAVRCMPRDVEPSPARELGAFDALPEGARLHATDVDADGRDELLAIDTEGALVALDTTTIAELEAIGALPLASGDLDGDCLIDVVLAGPEGARVVRGDDPDAASTTIGTAARDVATGVRTDEGARAIAIASEGGLVLSAWDEDAPRLLATGVFTRVLAGDLTGDGRDDLVATSDTATRVLLALESGFREEPGALPGSIATATGPIALGDLDGDGALDLVSATGATLRIALNRGDGLLEDRTGATAPMLAADARRLETVDLDGDCIDEIVALDAAGALSVWARDARGLWVESDETLDAVGIDLAVLDADGDGAREIAVLDASSTVTSWRP
ncbi:Hypothetical protein I5071_10840 [Sandaracinus amylolyticus]|nr:Hypothetical protein I5071_10840 [Sandaracinus amylolyticus]